jgi:hypothetical protein
MLVSCHHIHTSLADDGGCGEKIKKNMRGEKSAGKESGEFSGRKKELEI